MGESSWWDRFRYWIRPLCAVDDQGRNVCAWFWQRRKIRRLDAEWHRQPWADPEHDVQGDVRRFIEADKRRVDIAALATQHLIRGHSGEVLLCDECTGRAS